MRDTIRYIEGDLARVPGLECVAKALQTAIREIDMARPLAPVLPVRVEPRWSASASTAAFVPRRP